MNRSIILCILIALGAVAWGRTVWAGDAKPTEEQLAAAKKAYGEGKALFEEGKLAEAIEKFKESYRLSRSPLLLYNIGFTLDQAGQKDKALFYYRKFLADAPKDAAQRGEVTKRVDQIERENLEADLAGTTTPTPTTTTPAATTTPPKAAEEPKPVKIKPAGTYAPTEFQHQLVESAPPGKPLDVSAFVPEDSGWTVTLYYRGSGDTTFVARPMKWRYKELVGRIPGAKVEGSTIQYYIEVKDQAAKVVTRSGKSTSPNLVNVEAGAAPRFYPDLTDEGEAAITPQQQKRKDEEDPLNPNAGKSQQVVDDENIGGGGGGGSVEEPSGPPGTGYSDVGSKKFNQAKWVTTGAAGVLISGAAVSFFLGRQQAKNLEEDSLSCGQPPCRPFDAEYGIEVQKAGKRYNTIYQFTAGLGLASAVVAGYFWYRELTTKRRSEVRVTGKNADPEATWTITPSLGDGFTGAAAAARF